jgi:hypothetical protein
MLLFGVSAGLAMSCVSTASAQPSCFLQHQGRISDCKRDFNNPQPNPPFSFDNPVAYATCLEGSEADKDLCDANVPDGTRTTLWGQFKNNIDSCIRLFGTDPLAFRTCLNSALDTYLDAVDDILNPPAAACTPVPAGPTGITSRVGVMESIMQSPLIVDGKFPVAMQSTLSLTAGFSTAQGTAYDISEISCAKQAVLMAVRQTKDGLVFDFIAADLDTADGVNFEAELLASDYVGANDVVLVAIYVDENDDPIFGETALLSIQDSPVQGDWNRDGVKNTHDLIDFIEHFEIQNVRSDVNHDENIDSNDLAEFLATYAN